MGGVKRKLVVLSIEEKIKILNFLDENPLMKKSEIAEKFELPASTLSTIIKNREAVEQKFLVNKKARKSRKCTFPEVDKCVKEWFTQCRDQGIPISGKMVQKKAEDFARELGQDENFKSSNGWLESFKSRHAIFFHKFGGKSLSIPETVCVQDIPALLKGYNPQDIFFANETGLIYQCLPDKTAMIEDQKCRGGKTSKVRLTLLLASNQDGSEKLPPLMIGSSVKPRCFAKVKSFPFKYVANEKAWMTGDIFRNWLKSLNESMLLQKRKIILFIDNCSAHSDIPFLKNVVVMFLPANTASNLQPLNEGIIKNFKINYRNQLVCKLLDAISEGITTLPEISELDAMRMIDYAWRSVTQKTIQNCFKKAGFKNGCQVQNEIIKKEADGTAGGSNEVPEISSQVWKVITSGLNVDITLEEFLKMDDSLATCGTLTDAEIVDNVRTVVEDEETSKVEVPKITFKEAEEAVELLTTFLESQKNVGSEGFLAIYNLKRIIETKKACKKNNGQCR